MRNQRPVSRGVVACLVGVAIVAMAVTAGAIPYEAVKFEELRALLEAVKKNGEFTGEETHRLYSLLGLDRSDTTTIVAYAVGESRADDAILCDILRERMGGKGTLHAHIKLALLKKDLRGKPVAEKVKAFQELLDDPNDFVRLEAGKEIARIDPEKGKEALRPLMNADSSRVDCMVIGDAARIMYEMGEPDPEWRRHYNDGFDQYEGMISVIEGRMPFEYESFWHVLPPELLGILEQARETGEISEEQTAYVIECVKEGSQVTPQAKHVVSAIIYSKLKEPCPDLRAALEASMVERRHHGLPSALINVAVVKDKMRGRRKKALVEALEPLTRDSNPYLRIEAAKEIARVAPGEGKALLRQLYASDNTGIVQGEAARLLEKMGDEMPYGAAHRHFWDHNYFYMSVLELIEDEPLW